MTSQAQRDQERQIQMAQEATRAERQLKYDGNGCPHCGFVMLMRKRVDLFCLCCGWRECCYFGNDKENIKDYQHYSAAGRGIF